MENKRMNVIKNWPESKSIRDIQVFVRFPDFYRFFIHGFSKIAKSLTLILKTSFIARSGKNSIYNIAKDADDGRKDDDDSGQITYLDAQNELHSLIR